MLGFPFRRPLVLVPLQSARAVDFYYLSNALKPNGPEFNSEKTISDFQTPLTPFDPIIKFYKNK